MTDLTERIFINGDNEIALDLLDENSIDNDII